MAAKLRKLKAFLRERVPLVAPQHPRPAGAAVQAMLTAPWDRGVPGGAGYGGPHTAVTCGWSVNGRQDMDAGQQQQQHMVPEPCLSETSAAAVAAAAAAAAATAAAAAAEAAASTAARMQGDVCALSSVLVSIESRLAGACSVYSDSATIISTSQMAGTGDNPIRDAGSSGGSGIEQLAARVQALGQDVHAVRELLVELLARQH